MISHLLTSGIKSSSAAISAITSALRRNRAVGSLVFFVFIRQRGMIGTTETIEKDTNYIEESEGCWASTSCAGTSLYLSIERPTRYRVDQVVSEVLLHGLHVLRFHLCKCIEVGERLLNVTQGIPQSGPLLSIQILSVQYPFN